ncbi:hypothetical protein JCM30566_03050 [Marinitoga arctica]
MEKRLKILPIMNQQTLSRVKGISVTFVIFSLLIIVLIGFIIATLNIGSKIQTLKNNVSALDTRISDINTKIQTVSTEVEFFKQALIIMEED